MVERVDSITHVGWADLASHRPAQLALVDRRELTTTRRERGLWDRLCAVRDERGWGLGGETEEDAGRRWARLGGQWRVLHSAPSDSGDTDVDYLVIGPSGVFVIHTKNLHGAQIWIAGDTVLVDGVSVLHVRESRHEVARVARLLSAAIGYEVPVYGLVVVVGEQSFGVREQPEDGRVLVTTPRAGRRWIKHQRPRLSAGQVQRLYDAARRSSTWTEVPPPRTGG